MARKNRCHGLLPLRNACAETGDPQHGLAIVHIAGTNGKGSTTNYLKDILQTQGYRTGTFTSPHLTDHRDRIRINGEWIPKETFQMYLDRFMDVILKYDLGMFEIDLLIALHWMKDEKVDYFLMETGLGGRLDNTNIIDDPVLEVITTVAFDHMNVLGNRIQQIAFEKAGIIKPDSRCVCGHLNRHAESIIRNKAYRRHAAVVFPKFTEQTGHRFVMKGNAYEVQGGTYQKKNAALALQAAWMLGVNIADEKVIDAVRKSSWAGRFEYVRKDPDVIIDGAHNEEGINALISSIGEVKKPVTVVFSALKDKPGRKMAALLKQKCDRLIITHFENSRSGDERELLVDGAEVIHDWKEAVSEALKSTEGTVVITGSLYFISLVREMFSQ